jgi:predicted nucleotidyltransferase
MGFKILKVILFGSRARNDNRKESDWDFIVVLDRSVKWKEKMKLWMLINRRLAKIKADADIIFKSESEYNRDRNDVGKTTYYAAKEGFQV